MKKIIVFVILLTLVSCNQKKEILTIGIVQIAEHSSLDQVRTGIIEELKKEYKENIKIEYKNAQSDINILNNISQGFVRKKVDLIIAIATPSAQAAFSATQDIPIIFAAVSDPIRAGIIKDLKNPQTNASGTMIVVNVKKQLELLKELVPNSKKVGILYNVSEVNSQTQVDSAKELAKELNLEIIIKGVTSSNEISNATDSLLKEVDSLFIPTDSLITSSFPLVVQKAADKNIPIIGSVEDHVIKGALASNGTDHIKLGKESAIMAIEVLNGSKISDMAVRKSSGEELFINESVASKLKINISVELLKSAKIIK